MTVSSTTRIATATGNGIVTTFPYNFIIPDESFVVVIVRTIASEAEVELSPSDYTISGIGDDNGGNVEYPLVGSPLAATHQLIIKRVVDYVQELDVSAQSGFNSQVFEDQLDLMVMMIQQISDDAEAAVAVADDIEAAVSEAAASAAAAAVSEAAAAASAAAAATFNPASYPTKANNLSDLASLPTARTNLGVGTGDSPQFAAVNIGAATDTTLARASAGDVAVEGNRVFRVGGADVPVADGGTGASAGPAALDNLGAIFQKSYTSGNQTITAAGQLVLAHSLGAQPKLVQLFFKNLTTENGYSVGDELMAAPGPVTSSATDRGLSVVTDATNVTVRYSANAQLVIHKTTGVMVTLTPANWALIVRAYA